MTNREGDIFILFERSSACSLENGLGWGRVGVRDQLGGIEANTRCQQWR